MSIERQHFEDRVAQVIRTGGNGLPIGRNVPPFDPTRPIAASRRRVRRITSLVVAGAVVVSGSAAAAAVGLTSAPVSNLNEAVCYPIDSLANTVQTATIAASAPPGVQAKVTNALHQCSEVWAEGFFVLGSAKTQHVPPGPLTNSRPVPPLVVCVLSNGAAGVFPGGPSTCARLGLPKAGPSR